MSPHRTTTGKAALEPIRFGDPNLAEVLLQALSETEPIERWTHGFHTYPAGLHPDAAQALLAGFPGQRVFDPFVGGGTILVEARAAGRVALGSDVSPVALRVARTRAATPPQEVIAHMRATARKLTAAARTATELPPEPILNALQDWYAVHALRELESLRQGIASSKPEVRGLLETVFSSILVKTSWRRSDTNPQRERHHRPVGTTAILFHKKARELGRRLEAFAEAIPEGTPPAEIKWRDARQSGAPACDLILTSPPYPSTYDYLRLQHLRHIWLGDDVPYPSEIGSRQDWRQASRKALQQWHLDSIAWVKAVTKNLTPGGHLVVVIGDGITPSGYIDTSRATEESARAAGLVSVARASVEREDHAREAQRWEHAFAFQKPDPQAKAAP